MLDSHDAINKRFKNLIFGKNLNYAIGGGALVFTCLAPYPTLFLGVLFLFVGLCVNSYFAVALDNFFEEWNDEDEDEDFNPDDVPDDFTNNHDLYSGYNGGIENTVVNNANAPYDYEKFITTPLANGVYDDQISKGKFSSDKS